jgi:hypothetical protein
MKDVDNLKNFSARIPRNLWVFLKETSMKKEESMTSIVVDVLYKFMKKVESKKVD